MEVPDSAAAEAIQKAAENRVNELQICNPGNLHGRMVVKLVIGVDGRVKSTVVTSDGIKDKKLRKCITDAIRKWRFDAPALGSDITVKITLVF